MCTSKNKVTAGSGVFYAGRIEVMKGNPVPGVITGPPCPWKI
jgi:hypothetical protein